MLWSMQVEVALTTLCFRANLKSASVDPPALCEDVKDILHYTGGSRETIIEDPPVSSIGIQRSCPYSYRTSIQVWEASGSQCASHPVHL